MLLGDGYTRHIQLKEGDRTVNVLYRPATAKERRVCRSYWKKISEEAAERLIVEWIAAHVVACDLAWWRTSDAICEKLFLAIQGLIPDSSGEKWCNVEPKWKQNIMDGIGLLKKNPKLANRSCDHCMKYWYSDKTGDVLLDNSGKPQLRIAPPACRTQTGCPKGTPENQKSLNRANRLAVKHYQECKAVSQFPSDQLVRENAVVIERALR